MTTLAMALAGGLGAALRYLADAGMRPHFPRHIPVSTLVINISGSTALGLLVGAGASHTALLIVGTGLLGGFTTFSTASVESAHLWLERRHADALVLAAAMLVTCVLGAAIGVSIGLRL